MPGSKDWSIDFDELEYNEMFEKYLNPEKFRELQKLLDGVYEVHPIEEVKTARRYIVEEVSNIINHNSQWRSHPLRVTSKFSTGTIKFTIKYFGSLYHDPVKHNVTTVVGSVDERFDDYHREHEHEDTHTVIRINIKLKDQ